MATLHIGADKKDMAKTVLMPGDPLRAKFIAENYLENAKQISSVRNVLGYTGTYKDTTLTVLASGMGIPSIGIYSYELYNFYDVDNILRIGTAGAINADLELFDIVAGMGACTNSAYAQQYNLPGTFAPIASFDMLIKCYESAKETDKKLVVGNLLSADTFYDDELGTPLKWQKMNVLAVEMEAMGLYCNAARCGKNALAICAITDHFVKEGKLTMEERQTAVTDMIELGLDTAVKIERG